MVRRVLVEGRPGAGKTTVARRLVDLLREGGARVAGFTTEEIREGRRRAGFAVEDVSGRRAIMAHATLPGPPRVSRYGVDLEAFEGIALAALEGADRADAVVIDELGKMELYSERFRDAVKHVLDRPVPVVATVHVHRHPFTDGLKRRPDIEVLKVTERNRDTLPARLAELVGGDPLSR